MPIRANKFYAAVLVLAVICLVVSACASVKTPVPQPVTSVPTSTSAPALTETPAPTQTATALPVAATWTQQPSPTASPLPSLTPTPAPLSANGPWLVIAVDELDWQSATQFQVMNADGSGLQPLGLPAATENRAWLSLSEPRGPFLAFRTSVTGGSPLEIQADGVDDYVWILKLPENRVVRKLPLLSEAAWQVIHDAQANDPDSFNAGYNLPTQLGLVINPDSFQWSPHGRYLTYSAALDGTGTDLYLYDTQKDSTRRLTTGRAGAQVWSWSPDGGTVFYTNGSVTNIAYAFPELTSPEGRYAVDLALGSERRLYQPAPYWDTVTQPSEQEKLLVPDTAWQRFSPDGQWIVAGLGNIWKVYNRSGEAQSVEASGESEKIAWLNDSSGFYVNACTLGIQFYAQANAWQPVTIYPGVCTNFDLVQKP